MQNVYNEDRLIIWQKWFDPFGDDDPSISDNMQNDHLDDDDMDHDMEIDEENPLLKKPVRAIATPMGLIPYTENTASSKIFNFWVGHTNFTISNKIVEIIENVDGVETLDIFTRYRFRISVGKAFDAPTVMKQINDSVYEFLG
jgi:hypothetical protein